MLPAASAPRINVLAIKSSTSDAPELTYLTIAKSDVEADNTAQEKLLETAKVARSAAPAL